MHRHQGDEGVADEQGPEVVLSDPIVVPRPASDDGFRPSAGVGREVFERTAASGSSRPANPQENRNRTGGVAKKREKSGVFSGIGAARPRVLL